jgi:hypothetical protein
MSRGSCLDCARKHIAQAMILMDEAALGYPFHRWYAAGHLAEAESERRGEYPELARKIRTARLACMDRRRRELNFDDLIREACLLDGGPGAEDLAQDEASSKRFAPPDPDLTLCEGCGGH